MDTRGLTRRRAFWLALTVWVVANVDERVWLAPLRLAAQPEAYAVARGRLAEHDQPCVFYVGSASTSIALHPLNVTCLRLRELIARDVTVRLEVVVSEP